MWVLSVAVPRPLHQLYTYALPEDLVERIRVGTWLEVPFGKGKTDAFVVEPPRLLEDLSSIPGLDPAKIKSIAAVGDAELALPPSVLELAKWASDYYFTPLGEVIQSAYPTTALKKAPKRETKIKTRMEPLRAFQLSEEQRAAFEAISSEARRPTLLQGVTGSGKTEVYIELAKRALERGQGVMLLVPEIALTPQLYARLEASLGERIAVWHSAVAQGRRRSDWIALKKGEIRVVVGARSGVFAPVPNLGLIVVDEEHDPSFKQEERARYHARDLALVRAKLEKAKIVLGSATPSMESLERAREGRYQLVELKSRFHSGALPEVEVVDLCEEERVAGIQSVLAEVTLKRLQETLDRGEQAMVFLNRRGFASFMSCVDCGEAIQCPHCSVSLTVHKRGRQLRCHLCDYRSAFPDFCPKCRSIELVPIGSGTESLEEELPALLRGVRPARLDRDQVTSATRLEQILDAFRNRETNLLLGTQMLVKGHDFPGVTLVVVVLADSLFHWPDFRAAERAYQVLTQVAGRSGRGASPGKVLLQTFSKDHPVVSVLAGALPVSEFLESERALRQGLSYPPFARLCRLRFEGTDRDRVIRDARWIASDLKASGTAEIDVLGPSEALVEKVRGAYRWEILLKSKTIQSLRASVMRAISAAKARDIAFSVDLDPQAA